MCKSYISNLQDVLRIRKNETMTAYERLRENDLCSCHVLGEFYLFFVVKLKFIQCAASLELDVLSSELWLLLITFS